MAQLGAQTIREDICLKSLQSYICQLRKSWLKLNFQTIPPSSFAAAILTTYSKYPSGRVMQLLQVEFTIRGENINAKDLTGHSIFFRTTLKLVCEILSLKVFVI